MGLSSSISFSSPSLAVAHFFERVKMGAHCARVGYIGGLGRDGNTSWSRRAGQLARSRCSLLFMRPAALQIPI